MFKMFAIVMCTIALSALNAMAQGEIKPQFSSLDVLSHFDKAANTHVAVCPVGEICLPKKKSRGLCLGPQSKCGANRQQAQQPTGFDLLVTFELGSDALSELAKANLAEFAKAMRTPEMIDKSFNVEGHTDARGADSLNMVLSERRATIVVEYLHTLGVGRGRLHVRGFGESRPRIKSDPFAGVNRRVEATIRTK